VDKTAAEWFQSPANAPQAGAVTLGVVSAIGNANQVIGAGSGRKF
jgi:hypothetical protein